MTNFIQFAILGLGEGSILALLALGIVVIYWGSGVINLAHGAMAMYGAFLFYWLNTTHDWSFWPSLVVATALMAVMGVVISQGIMRPLRHASSLSRVVATLGILIVLQGSAALIWGVRPLYQKTELPFTTWKVGSFVFPKNAMYMLAIAAGITVALILLYRFTRVGLAIRAGAQNPRSAAALGWSPDTLAAFTWALGCALAAVAGILISPISGISVDDLPQKVIPALAAALIGGFSSFGLTTIGALGIGSAQSEVVAYVHQPGLEWAVPLAVIVVYLAVRGKGLPVRGFFVERLPEVGDGNVRWRWVFALSAVFSVLVFTIFPANLLDALTISISWATIMLSVVVLLGFTSQLSFEQMGMAGLTALIAGRIAAGLNLPFVLALLLAVVVSVPIGVLFALPALRTRGVNLAVLTLALGMVIFQAVFSNGHLTGGADGLKIGSITFLGIDINGVTHPDRYCFFVLIMFVLCSVVVANVRRGSSGRRLLAVRTNERAAASLGISVFGAKVFAFILGASMASIGGVILAFRQPLIDYSQFDPYSSVQTVGYTVLGSVGYVLGPIFGSFFAPGGFGFWISQELFQTINQYYLVTIGGFITILVLLQDPDGIASMSIKAAKAGEGQSKLAYLRLEVLVLRGWAELRKRFWTVPPPVGREALPRVERKRVAPGTLEARDVTVRYGGVVAVAGVSVTVGPGEIVGLIGPNGAGKTSMIDAVTGFVRTGGGETHFNGERIDGWPVYKRTRLGVSRTFQSLELFEQSTVLENLLVASDPSSMGSRLLELVKPSESELAPEAIAAVHEFELEPDLDTRVSDLPYGRRRLLAIARAIAGEPSILLLDEPAAGLSDTESAELGVMVQRLAKEWGMGILVVEHDMTFVMGTCDRIVVMDFGRPLAEGTPAEIRANPAVIAAYLGEPELEAALASSTGSMAPSS